MADKNKTRNEKRKEKRKAAKARKKMAVPSAEVESGHQNPEDTLAENREDTLAGDEEDTPAGDMEGKKQTKGKGQRKEGSKRYIANNERAARRQMNLAATSSAPAAAPFDPTDVPFDFDPNISVDFDPTGEPCVSIATPSASEAAPYATTGVSPLPLGIHPAGSQDQRIALPYINNRN
jgi:hypothetical protein